jgi:hypothetical protein
MYRRALALSVALALVGLTMRLPGEARFLILIGVPAFWLWAGARWSIQRYGQAAAITIAVLVLAASGLAAWAYWRDAPNRRLVAQIEALPGCYAATSGGVLAGKVDHVYISSKAGDREVLQFTEVAGLDDLKILFLDGSRISDETAARIGRLKSLRHLCFSGTGVSEEVVEELRRQLPECEVEVKD